MTVSNRIPKILVTGGAGYVGAHFLHHLKSTQNVQPVVFDNLRQGILGHLPPGCQLIEGDLLNPADLDRAFAAGPFDCVFHFAALAEVGESFQDPGAYFRTNVQGGLNLLEAMRKDNCKKLVFSSTCAVYGQPPQSPITEAFPTKPVNPYGHSKLMFEQILDWYDQIHQIHSVHLRYFNAAGAGFGIGEAHAPESHLIPIVMQAALGQRPSISVFGNDYATQDGTCERDYIHVLDLADAHWAAFQLLLSAERSEVVNLGTGEAISVAQVIERITKLTGRQFPVQVSPRRLGDPDRLVASREKAEQLLQWEPKRSFEEIIQSAWEWHLGQSQKG